MNPEFKGYYQTFGQNVVLYRRRKRLTQAQLALLVGVDRSHISAVELGRVGVSLDLIFKLCNALDIAPQQLFDIGERQFNRGSPAPAGGPLLLHVGGLPPCIRTKKGL